MPLWIVSSAGSGSATHWNQPPSSSRFTRSAGRRCDLHFHDDRRVRHAERLGEDDADLAEALVVGLQPGEHEIELLGLHRRGERVRDATRVGGRQRVGLDVNRRGRRRGRAPRGSPAPRAPARREQTTTSPPCFSFEAQRLFERVGVGLVQLEAGVLVADPGLLVVHAQLPLARHDLLDADGDFHDR